MGAALPGLRGPVTLMRKDVWVGRAAMADMNLSSRSGVRDRLLGHGRLVNGLRSASDGTSGSGMSSADGRPQLTKRDSESSPGRDHRNHIPVPRLLARLLRTTAQLCVRSKAR